MRRGLIAGLLTAIACGFWYPVVRDMAAAGSPLLVDVVLIAMAVIAVLAVAGVTLALRANTHMRHLRADIEQMTRSLDACLRDLALRSDRDASARHALASLVEREFASISDKMTSAKPVAAEPAPQPQMVSANPVTAHSNEKMNPETAIRAALAAGPPTLLLRPIVSVTANDVVGFEALANIERRGRPAIVIDRVPAFMSDVSQAAFERWMIEGVLALPVDETAKLPVHVRVTTLLADDTELAAITGIVRKMPKPAVRRIVLSIHSSAMLSDDPIGPALRRLTKSGMTIAAEGWPGTTDTLSTLRQRGAILLKVSAGRLLGPLKDRAASEPLPRFIEVAAAANMPLMATNVKTSAEATAVVERGVDILGGPHFLTWSPQTQVEQLGERQTETLS